RSVPASDLHSFPTRRSSDLGAEVIFGGNEGFAPVGEGTENGAFFEPTLLLARQPQNHSAHDVEAFGPVSTLMAYSGGIEEAVALDRKSTRLNSSHVKISYAV